MKIPEIYNNVLGFIWINLDSLIFLYCIHINRNMRILIMFEILERCIDLSLVLHTVLSFVICQRMGAKNVGMV